MELCHLVVTIYIPNIHLAIDYLMCDHKTSHKGQLLLLINELSIDVWFVMIGQYLAEIQLFDNLEYATMLLLLIKNTFLIFTLGKKLNIFMEHDLNILKIFGIK